MTPPRYWALLLWAVTAAALFAALLLAAFSYGTWAYGRYLDRDGLATQARVVDSDVTSVSVEFANYRGSRSVAVVRWWAPGAPGVGDEIAVVYDPWDPRDAVRAGRPENRVVAIGAAAGSAVMVSVAVGAGVGAGLIHRARRP